jgi:flagellar motor switch protein FliN/FliY
MTIQASLIDLDALLEAGRSVATYLNQLGELKARALGPEERSGGQFGGGVELSVRTGGAGPGQVGLIAGSDAAAALAGAGDVLERWEPVMAAIVVALTNRVGDLQPQEVQILATEVGSGPALDPGAISIGIFRDDQLLAAIGFVAEHSTSGATFPAGLDGQQEPDAAPVFQALVGVDKADVEVRRMHLLRDVEMGVSVELGRTRMTVRELLALAPGAIVELDKPAGAPVDLLVNGTLMARGEVVVIDEEFAVRISEIVTPELADRRGASDRRGA